MPRLRRMLQNHKKALAVGMQLDGSDAVAPPIPFETIMASLGALTASAKAAVATRLGLPRPNYFLTRSSDEGNGVRSALRPRRSSAVDAEGFASVKRHSRSRSRAVQNTGQHEAAQSADFGDLGDESGPVSQPPSKTRSPAHAKLVEVAELFKREVQGKISQVAWSTGSCK